MTRLGHDEGAAYPQAAEEAATARMSATAGEGIATPNPASPVFCLRCNRHHEREGEAEENCQRGMQFARADHRRRGGVE